MCHSIGKGTLVWGKLISGFFFRHLVEPSPLFQHTGYCVTKGGAGPGADRDREGQLAFRGTAGAVL